MTMSTISAVLHDLIGGPPREASPDRIAELVRAADPLLASEDVDGTVREIRNNLDGLGPVMELLDDPALTDLLINGDGGVWVDRGSGVTPTSIVLEPTEVTLLMERVLAPLGRSVNPVDPVADARLPDGSRVHMIVPPLAIDGPCITIRRFGARTIGLEEVASPEAAELLRRAVTRRANIVVCGGTGSGKTTLLNALGSHIDPRERLVTVEDAAELRLPAEHVVRLETRPRSVEGLSDIDARELVRNALRMRPDRVLLGEVRGPEALDLIQAMNTGHDGSLSTVHANSGEDALRRLETLVLLAGIGLPLEAVREHLASAIDLIIHIARFPDGSRGIREISEVLPPPCGDGPRCRTLSDGRRILASPIREPRTEAHP